MERDGAKLLVVDTDCDELADRRIVDWPSLVAPGSLVVLNDTKVVKARLIGSKSATSGRAELLLVQRCEPDPDFTEPASVERWRAIGKGLRELRGQELVFGHGDLSCVVEGPSDVDGIYVVRLHARHGTVSDAIDAHGRVPIPPYIRRSDDDADVDRYQTVYARSPGAIAAPTAGLHLTTSILDELRAKGARIAHLTLHVGLGTFQPVSAEDLDHHSMHAEQMQITQALVDEVAAARARRAPVVAVGTTVVRALEAARDVERPGFVRPYQGETRLLIQPGYSFGVVDALLTNFHLPRSTLLVLVAGFAGRERILRAYEEAVRRGYRFFSYGDAMWLPRSASGHRS
jgi:S-adenosylmethionine:tRNA ribosyltransferase-isomerase